jgi:hypothetical protein
MPRSFVRLQHARMYHLCVHVCQHGGVVQLRSWSTNQW